MAETKPKFAKLDNTNYANWKFKMELLLRKQNLWEKVIIGERPEPARDAHGTVTNKKDIDDWDEYDDEARGTIGLLIEDDQLAHIRTMKTAKDTWEALRNYHEKNTLTNKVFLMRSICSLKLDERDDAKAHINRMQDLFIKLHDIGEEALSDKWSAAILLSSLPESYDALITTLESRKEEEVTFALVQQRVIAEYERHLHADHNPNDAILKTVAKISTCYFCKKSGHLKKNCTKYIEWKAKQERDGKKDKDANGKGTHKVNSVEEKSSSQGTSKDINNDTKDFMFIKKFIKNIKQKYKTGWIIDSGATRHVVNDKNFFTKIDESCKSSVELANSKSVIVEGIGTGELTFVDKQGYVHKAMATEVLYAPCLVGNMLSVRQLTKNGFRVEFNNRICEIKYEGKQVGIADTVDEVYILRQPVSVCTVFQHNDRCIHQWHRKMGHRDPQAIRMMHSKDLIKGLEIVDCNIKETCDTCMKGKMTRLPFPNLFKVSPPLVKLK